MRDRHWSEEMTPDFMVEKVTAEVDREIARVARARAVLADHCASAADRAKAEMIIAQDALSRPDPYEPE